MGKGCLPVLALVLLLGVGAWFGAQHVQDTPTPTALIPLDSRPCNTSEAQLLGQAAGRKVYLPQEGLDHFFTAGDPDTLWAWLEDHADKYDEVIIFSNELLNGGLTASRSLDSYAESEAFIDRLYAYLTAYPKQDVTVVTVLPRSLPSSADSLLEAHSPGLEAWGQDVYLGRSLTDLPPTDPSLPQEAATRYAGLYQAAYELTVDLASLEADGLLDTYLVALDDHQPESISLLTAELVEESLGRPVLHGGDELASMLLALPAQTPVHAFFSALQPKPTLSVIYTHPDQKDKVSAYESMGLDAIVQEKASFLGFEPATPAAQALLVSNQIGDPITLAEALSQIPAETPWALADVALTNAGDPLLQATLTSSSSELIAYAGWNTTANAIGTSLAALRVATLPYADHETLRDYMAIRVAVDQVYLGQLGPVLWPHWHERRLIDGYGHFASYAAQGRCTDELNQAYQDLRAQDPGLPDVTFSFPWPRTFEVAADFS